MPVSAARELGAMLALVLVGCLPGVEEDACGPRRAVVQHVIDGDTIELRSGERVRYLLVDTPESTTQVECFGSEAAAFNRMLVEGREVSLTYDSECTDAYGRLLAYVEADGASVNRALVEQGYACVLQIPPNGVDRAAEFYDLETRAVDDRRGLWSVCADTPC